VDHGHGASGDERKLLCFGGAGEGSFVPFGNNVRGSEGGNEQNCRG
jgi:hypothetical protein